MSETTSTGNAPPLELYAKKAQLLLNGEPEPLSAGMAGVVQVRFRFSDDWGGLERTAVFTNGTRTVDVPEAQWDADMCTVPEAVLETAGKTVMAGVYGTNGLTVALPTVWCAIGRVEPSAAPSGRVASPVPALSALERRIQALEDQDFSGKLDIDQTGNEGKYLRVRENGEVGFAELPPAAQTVALDEMTAANAPVYLAAVNAARSQGIPIVARDGALQAQLISAGQDKAVFHANAGGMLVIYTLTSAGVEKTCRAVDLMLGVKSLFMEAHDGCYEYTGADFSYTSFGELIEFTQAGMNLRLVLQTGANSGEVFDLAGIEYGHAPVLWFRGQTSDGTGVTEHLFSIDEMAEIAHVAGRYPPAGGIPEADLAQALKDKILPFTVKITCESGGYHSSQTVSGIRAALDAGRTARFISPNGSEGWLAEDTGDMFTFGCIDTNAGGSAPALNLYTVSTGGVTLESRDIINPTAMPVATPEEVGQYLGID